MFYAAKRPKTHMAIVLTLDGVEWLCDLGFGSYGIRAPLSLTLLDTDVQQDFDTFKLSKVNDREYLVQALVDGTWANQHAFDLNPQEWIDFMPANYLNSTHPDAVFVQKMLVILHNQTGRKILFGDMLKTIANGHVEKETIHDSERANILANTFGLAFTT